MTLSRVLAILILQYSLVALVSSAGPPSGWKTLQGVFLILLPFSLLMFPWSSFVFLLASFVRLLRLMAGRKLGIWYSLELETLSLILMNYLLCQPFLVWFMLVVFQQLSQQWIVINFSISKKIRSKPCYYMESRINRVCIHSVKDFYFGIQSHVC